MKSSSTCSRTTRPTWRSNPQFQEFFRKYQPPLLATWGKNDPFFLLPAGAEAYQRDIPKAEVKFYDTGHFALETHCSEIAAEIIPLPQTRRLLAGRTTASSAGDTARRLTPRLPSCSSTLHPMKHSRKLWRLLLPQTIALLLLAFAITLGSSAQAEPPAKRSPDEVLVVYNSNSPISTAIAQDYQAKRQVKTAVSVQCKDAAMETENETISYADYKASIETPVRAYLASHPSINFIVTTQGCAAAHRGRGNRLPQLAPLQFPDRSILYRAAPCLRRCTPCRPRLWRRSKAAEDAHHRLRGNGPSPGSITTTMPTNRFPTPSSAATS